MDPVNSNSSNGLINVSYPLDLVDQAREVMLGANRELFLAKSADASDATTQFSEMSSRLSARLDEFSTLLSSTEFFSESFLDQSQTEGAETQESAFTQALGDDFLDGEARDDAEALSLDLDAQAQSVRTVIDEYNGLVEWLDSSQYAISPSLKSDLFKDMNSDVLAGVISDVSAVREDSGSTIVEGNASQSLQTAPFSPQVSVTSDSTVESAFSRIGLTLNTDGSLDIKKEFEQEFKANFNQAYDALSGEDGFFTKISSALDTLNNRDSRFNVARHRNDNTQVYTNDADVQVRNAYRANVATLLNTFA